jgi:hypothetical protein
VFLDAVWRERDKWRMAATAWRETQQGGKNGAAGRPAASWNKPGFSVI